MTTMKTNQEIFDICSVHLLTQMKKSSLETARGDECLYRGPNGLMCAIGPLLTDEFATTCENWSFAGLVSNYTDEMLAQGLDSSHIGLCEYLQSIHDRDSIASWRFELKELARDSNFSTEKMDAIPDKTITTDPLKGE